MPNCKKNRVRSLLRLRWGLGGPHVYVGIREELSLNQSSNVWGLTYKTVQDTEHGYMLFGHRIKKDKFVRPTVDWAKPKKCLHIIWYWSTWFHVYRIAMHIVKILRSFNSRNNGVRQNFHSVTVRVCGPS